jgi:hypothetical protein
MLKIEKTGKPYNLVLGAIKPKGTLLYTTSVKAILSSERLL